MPQNTEKVFNIIRDSVLFKGTDEAIIKALLKENNIIQCVKKGDTIYDTEHFSRSLGIIIEGSCKAENTAGNKSVILKKFKEGDMFGAAALFTQNENYVSKITAITDCVIVFISQEEAERLVRSDSAFALNYIAFLSDRIRFLNSKIDGFTAKSIEEKVIHGLYSLPKAEDGRTLINSDLRSLANSLNISRASLYRALDNLCREGKIEKKGTLIILPPEK